MPRPCSAVSKHEPRFRSLLVSLFNSSALLQGSVVDTGAHSGGESCFFASLDARRIVHAIEPLPRHQADLLQYSREHQSIQPFAGALGAVPRLLELTGAVRGSMLKSSHLQGNASKTSTTSVQVHRLDDLFTQKWPSEKLAFAHIDVEGSEDDVIAGATTVIGRDRPVFTVESMLKHSVAHARLLSSVHAMGYQALLVPEQCGRSPDCRNFICVPNERIGLLPEGIAILKHAQSGSMLA